MDRTLVGYGQLFAAIAVINLAGKRCEMNRHQ